MSAPQGERERPEKVLRFRERPGSLQWEGGDFKLFDPLSAFASYDETGAADMSPAMCWKKESTGLGRSSGRDGIKAEALP